jgi:hypothetical protein
MWEKKEMLMEFSRKNLVEKHHLRGVVVRERIIFQHILEKQVVKIQP